MRNSELKDLSDIHGCLITHLITPIKIMGFLERTISTKTDSRSLGRYRQASRSILGLKAKQFEICNITPPAVVL